MEHRPRYTMKLFGVELSMWFVAILFLVPFYFVFVNSVKSPGEMLMNAASLPKQVKWDNFANAWKILNFPRVLLNTFVITSASILGIVVVSSMSAYRLARRKTKTNAVIYSLFVASMVIPFQSIMIPIVKVESWLNLSGTYAGVVLCYIGIGCAFAIFLYHGFVKSIPVEIEEAAFLDGCSKIGVFIRIIFPLLTPITITVILLDTFWIWNDFMLPLILINKQDMRTIQLAINSLLGQYTRQWDLALPALIMGITPAVIFFIALQNKIIKGVSDGAVKG